MRIMKLAVAGAVAAGAVAPAQAGISDTDVEAFLEAQRLATLEGSEEAIGGYVGMMAEDVVDRHVSYGVEFAGTDHFVSNLPNRAASIEALDYRINSITIREDIALLDYVGHSTGRDADGSAVENAVRWLIVLDYDDSGKVEEMRRYSVPDYTR